METRTSLRFANSSDRPRYQKQNAEALQQWDEDAAKYSTSSWLVNTQASTRPILLLHAKACSNVDTWPLRRSELQIDHISRKAWYCSNPTCCSSLNFILKNISEQGDYGGSSKLYRSKPANYWRAMSLFYKTAELNLTQMTRLRNDTASTQLTWRLWDQIALSLSMNLFLI